MSAYAIFAKDEDGSSFIPASQRPDGTWRKQRRVKDGYVPQDEVPLYESKGKQFAKSKPQYPVGMTPDIVNNISSKPQLSLPITKRSPIPGLVIEEDYVKKIKNKKKNSNQQGKDSVSKVTEKISQVNIKDTKETNKSAISTSIIQDPAKRLKNLKKKLREIESIEQKIKSGEIKKPEKEQLEKVSRRVEVVKEIAKLEKALS